MALVEGDILLSHHEITFMKYYPLSVADSARYTYTNINVNTQRQDYQLPLTITPWFSHCPSLQKNHYSHRATRIPVSLRYTSGSLTMSAAHCLLLSVMYRWQQYLCSPLALSLVSARHASVPVARAGRARPSGCKWKPGIWRVLAECWGSQTHTIPLQTNKQTNNTRHYNIWIRCQALTGTEKCYKLYSQFLLYIAYVVATHYEVSIWTVVA
jgi:hypothetical protein